VRMRTATALLRTQELAELVRALPKGGRCGGADANREDKTSLSFLLFLFFGETVYVDEGSRPVILTLASRV